MSASKCITGKAEAGLVSKTKTKALMKDISLKTEALVAQGEDISTATLKAEMQAEKELAARTTRNKWRIINDVRVQTALQAMVDGADPKKLGRMQVAFVENIDFEARAEHKRITGKVAEFIGKHRPDFWGLNSDPASFLNVLKAMGGEKVDDEAAKLMAASVNDVNEWIRKNLNSYGFSIGKIDGYVPHKHDQITVGKARPEVFFADIDGRLDWPGMRNPKTNLEFGVKPSEEYRRAFIKGMQDNIAYGRNSDKPVWGGNADGWTIERHRTLKFKSADDWVAYNNKYGSADPHSALLSHWGQMAREVAIARRLGPTAETAVDYLGQIVAAKQREAQIGAIDAQKSRLGNLTARHMVRVMKGGVGPASYYHAISARFFSTTRKALTGALLDRASIIAVPSDMNSARMAAQAIGMNPANVLSNYQSILLSGVKDGSITRQDLLRSQHISESWANPGVTMARYETDYPAARWAEMATNGAMRAQGLIAHTDAIKLSFQWGMEAEMASLGGKGFSELHPQMRMAMNKAGIDAKDWDTFRSGPVFTAANGAEILTPVYWQSVTDLDPVVADQIFLKFQTFVERWQELAVPSRSLIGQSLLDPNAWGLSPGGVAYEFVKSAGMFKSFPVAFVVNQKRMFDMHEGVAAKASYAINLLVSTTLVGATSFMVGDLLMGRDPQTMDEDWVWRSMLRGGGLGPVADILHAGTTSWGGGLPAYLTGPMPQLFGDAVELTFGNVIDAYWQARAGDDIDVDLFKEIISFASRYAPGAQSPAALGGAAVDRMILDQLLIALDPEAIDDMAKKAKKRENLYGGGHWWAPGSPLPTRAPDLGTALR